MKRKIILDHDESGFEHKIARTRIEIIETRRESINTKPVTNNIPCNRLQLHTVSESPDWIMSGTRTDESNKQGALLSEDNQRESHISETILRKELSIFREKVNSLETQLFEREHKAEVDRCTISTLRKTNDCIMSKNEKLNDELTKAHSYESALLEKLSASQRKIRNLQKRSCHEQYKAVVLELNKKLDECYERERSLQERLSNSLKSIEKNLSEEQERNQIQTVLVSKLKESDSELKKARMREASLQEEVSACLNSIGEQVSKEKYRAGYYASMLLTLSKSNATLTAANKRFHEERKAHKQLMVAEAMAKAIITSADTIAPPSF